MYILHSIPRGIRCDLCYVLCADKLLVEVGERPEDEQSDVQEELEELEALLPELQSKVTSANLLLVQAVRKLKIDHILQYFKLQ